MDKLTKLKLKKLYLSLLPAIREEARACGYAVGLHGSLTRDMDIMAMAWTDDAVEEKELVERISKVVKGTRLPDHSEKPHGRHAYTIILDNYKSNTNWSVFIDLSIK